MSDGDIYKVSASARKIRNIYNDIQLNGHTRAQTFTVGRVEGRMKDFAAQRNTTLAGKSIYMSAKSIAHTFRQSKRRDQKTVSIDDLAKFPLGKSKMDLFWDGEVFVYTDYKSKFIVHPNYKMKIGRNKGRRVNYITATKVTDSNEFSLSKYTKV